jgi:hypothetical protein
VHLSSALGSFLTAPENLKCTWDIPSALGILLSALLKCTLDFPECTRSHQVSFT